MKRTYKTIKLRPDSLALIETCNDIIDDYQQQGLRLTLRQLYYQLVSRNVVPNTERSYKRVGSIISDGRLSGLVDWEAIEDRNREPVIWQEYDNVKDFIETAIGGYRRRRWNGQSKYVELWVEKAALAGVLEPLAAEFHATLMVNRGYSSQSAMYESAKRFRRHMNSGQNNDGVDKDGILFYLGDHDPSGEDMVRDIQDRMNLFGVDVDVRKLALTMAQVQQYNPPPNPAKMTDSRASGYVAQHGSSSWEVDALNPSTLAQIVRSAFASVIDKPMMDAVKAKERKDRTRLEEAAERIASEEEEEET